MSAVAETIQTEMPAPLVFTDSAAAAHLLSYVVRAFLHFPNGVGNGDGKSHALQYWKVYKVVPYKANLFRLDFKLP